MKLKVHLIQRGTLGESHFHFHRKRETCTHEDSKIWPQGC